MNIKTSIGSLFPCMIEVDENERVGSSRQQQRNRGALLLLSTCLCY